MYFYYSIENSIIENSKSVVQKCAAEVRDENKKLFKHISGTNEFRLQSELYKNVLLSVLFWYLHSSFVSVYKVNSDKNT